MSHDIEPTIAEPFKVHFPFQQNWQPKTVSFVNGAIERVFALDQLNHVYHVAKSQFQDLPFTEGMMNTLHISYHVPESDFARIPRKGRLIVVANHPFGGLEGLILSSLLNQVRGDIKLMANFLLEKIPDMKESTIFVDPFGTAQSSSRNRVPLKAVFSHLDQEGVLGVFPSGGVSHLHLKKGRIEDPPWSTTIARIAQKTETPVLPIYFEGKNSLLFQLAGLCHSRIRTALLPHEFMNKKGQQIGVRVGNVIPPNRILEIKNERKLTDFLRERTYFLSHGSRLRPKARRFQLPIFTQGMETQAIVEAESSELLEKEILLLPPKNQLLRSGAFEVYYARAKRIPHILQEIGRLREVTFRAAGEGSGKSVDLDRFDQYYHHLWVWNSEKKEIVGAYRLGQTDKIIPYLGKKGLYTATLFNYRKKLLEDLNPALEMGRSFVRKEYQRHFQSLLLLWKGIAAYVSQKPRYRYLFGPVSISQNYQPHSRDLMVQFLEQNNLDLSFSKEVKGRNPVNFFKKFISKMNPAEYKSLEEIHERVAELETELKGLPVLLTQYLRLGGKILGFSEDKKFSHVIDALILVDLTETDPKILGRYMGSKELERYRDFQKKKSSS